MGCAASCPLLSAGFCRVGLGSFLRNVGHKAAGNCRVSWRVHGHCQERLCALFPRWACYELRGQREVLIHLANTVDLLLWGKWKWFSFPHKAPALVSSLSSTASSSIWVVINVTEGHATVTINTNTQWCCRWTLFPVGETQSRVPLPCRPSWKPQFWEFHHQYACLYLLHPLPIPPNSCPFLPLTWPAFLPFFSYLSLVWAHLFTMVRKLSSLSSFGVIYLLPGCPACIKTHFLKCEMLFSVALLYCCSDALFHFQLIEVVCKFLRLKTFPIWVSFIVHRETGADGIDTSPRPARMMLSSQSGQVLWWIVELDSLYGGTLYGSCINLCL